MGYSDCPAPSGCPPSGIFVAGVISPGTVLSRDGLFLFVFEDAVGGIEHLFVDLAIGAGGFGKRNRYDPVAAQRGHLAELAMVDHVNGAEAVAGGEYAIERGGRAPALHVTKNYGTGFKAGAVLDLLRQGIADSAQAGMPELVFFAADCNRATSLRGKLRAFRHHDDAEVASASVTHADPGSDFIDIEWLFGDEDHVGASGDATVHRNPTRIAAHDL